MVVTIVGLGLIGGSFCKAIKARTSHTCYGIDTDRDVIAAALESGAIEEEAHDLAAADLTVICLYPGDTIAFLLKNAAYFKEGSIVIDACGIKSAVVNAVTAPLAKNGVTFIGAHPMAGREFSGFSYSLEGLFDGASLILTPTDETPAGSLKAVIDFGKQLGFKPLISSPDEHDRIIAYTSQLAHVVSGAYIKSPTLQKSAGFSAGSFKDLTRVAKLNENMWTDLFLLNRDALMEEIEQIISRLEEYRAALAYGDDAALRALLKQGRILKEFSDEVNR